MNEELAPVDKVEVGRILHYVGLDICYAAVVTKGDKNGFINLQIFPNQSSPTYFVKDIKPSHKELVHGTWHWPRECKNLA